MGNSILLTKLAVFVLFFTLCTNCSKDDRDFLERRLSANVAIPSNINNIETHYFYIRNQPTLFQQTILQRALTNEQISSVNASNCTISNRFGNLDMSFISSISIRALSTSDRTKRAEMFYLEQIPLTQRTNLNLQTSISELKEIMQNETFDIEIRLQIRGFVPVGLTLQLDFGYIAFFN